MELVVRELAAQSVGAEAVLQEVVALLLAEGRDCRQADEFVGAVGEAALAGIGAAPSFRKVLAEFGLVLEGIGLGVAQQLFPVLAGAVSLSRVAGAQVAGSFVHFYAHLLV